MKKFTNEVKYEFFRQLYTALHELLKNHIWLILIKKYQNKFHNSKNKI
jgi:hypothetical protein